MTKLILHIGTMKTGSTALQDFFFHNQDALARQGVIYPLFGRQHDAPIERNGAFLRLLTYYKLNKVDPASRIEKYNQNEATWNALSSSQNSVLLSDEIIYTGTSKPFKDTDQTWTELFWENIHNILLEAGISHVNVVIYLRRQDALIASRWKHIVAVGLTSLSFHEYLVRPNNLFYLDYAATLKIIERELKDMCTISVRRYDYSAFYRGTIFSDFCNAVGISWDDSFMLPKHDINPSISYDAAEALRLLFQEIPTREMRHRLVIPKALALTRENPDPSGITPFSEEEARTLLEPFQEGNRWIAQHYLGEESLFSECYTPAAVWVPNQELIAKYREQMLYALRAQ